MTAIAHDRLRDFSGETPTTFTLVPLRIYLIFPVQTSGIHDIGYPTWSLRLIHIESQRPNPCRLRPEPCLRLSSNSATRPRRPGCRNRSCSIANPPPCCARSSLQSQLSPLCRAGRQKGAACAAPSKLPSVAESDQLEVAGRQVG